MTLLALFGFGHHAAAAATAAPSALGGTAAALRGVPPAIWVALIGLVSAIAGPVAAHVLEERRARRGTKDG